MQLTFNHYFFVPLSLLLLLSSCDNEKEALNTEFQTISYIIHNNKYKLLYNKLDEESQNYLNFFSDTTNYTFPKMQLFGAKNKLTILTTAFNQQWGEIAKESGDPHVAFYTYLSLTSVSLFSWTTKPKLIKDKAETGKENYVVLAKKVNDNSYITSKIYFTKDKNGAWKLNLLSLLTLREKLLQQSFNFYLKNKRRAEGEKKSYTYMLQEYIQNMYSTKHQLNSITYDSRKVN